MPVTPDNDPYYRLRHSTAHVLAEAVLELFPDGKIAIGPPIEDGFYYDFDLPRPLTPDDLAEIEARMRQDHRRQLPVRLSRGQRRRGPRAVQGASPTSSS